LSLRSSAALRSSLVSTRKLIVVAMLTGLLILVAFALQATMATR